MSRGIPRSRPRSMDGPTLRDLRHMCPVPPARDAGVDLTRYRHVDPHGVEHRDDAAHGQRLHGSGGQPESGDDPIRSSTDDHTRTDIDGPAGVVVLPDGDAEHDGQRVADADPLGDTDARASDDDRPGLSLPRRRRRR